MRGRDVYWSARRAARQTEPGAVAIDAGYDGNIGDVAFDQAVSIAVC
jgi:hypothetical protein